MSGSALELGDSHNFGRRVVVGPKHVEKPRTVLWEWLLLAAESPLRKALDEAALTEGLGPNAFGFLPALAFSRTRARTAGGVERIVLKPLPVLSSARKRELAAIVGRALALFGWLGVADLHWENLVLGLDETGNLVFSPVDIEMILAELSLPTETKLLPDPDPEVAAICRHAAGVRRVLPYLGKPLRVTDLVAMAAAYRNTLVVLERHGVALATAFERLPGLRTTPIRVCLRGTEAYVRAGSEPVWPPLLDAEMEQLARGDIPYFFRLYGRRGIFYYENRALSRLARLPLTGDVPRLDPMLKLSRGLRSPLRSRLREEGLFAVLGAFDHPSFAGTHRDGELEVSFGKRALTVKLATGEVLRSGRNLGALVGSVYLSCRCGEVRSVFVPPVTVCRPSTAC